MTTRTKKKPSIVVIGGGNGTAALLTALRGHARITAILSPTDNGGSGGWCREEFDMIAPGDFRRALVALSYSPNTKLKKTFLHRYTDGPLRGHVVGNLVLASLFESTGSFDRAITETAKLLMVQDAVFAATNTLTTLCAELADGKILRGETTIDKPLGARAAIKRIFLSPAAVPAHPRAIQAIQQADAILLAPGDLYTSLLPSMLVPGIRTALKKSAAPKILFVNTFNKKGETDGYTVSDFIRHTEEYLDGATITTAIVAKNAGDVKLDQHAVPAHVHILHTPLVNPRTPAAHNPARVRQALKKIGIL
jgi:uncharacterized cofD-like protein